MSVRLTEKRLGIIIDALAYWDTILDDPDCGLWETEAEYRRIENEREQAFIWAHQELAKRKARKTT